MSTLVIPRALRFALPIVALTATVVAALPQGRGGGRAPAPAPAPAPGSERTAPTEPQGSEDDLSAFYFRTADWDGDEWIGLIEASQSMGLDRPGLALFDKDRDGGITQEEFTARYQIVIERGGAFPPPRPKPDAPRPAKRDAKALLLAYDTDLDGMLVESEVSRALQEARISDPSPVVVVSTLDEDRSSGIDGAELDELSDLLFPVARPKRDARPRTLAELFDRTEARSPQSGTTISPRRTAGPVHVFRRLDYDRSGAIDLVDLEELQRPLRSAVRAGAVLATLDLDGDGTISAAEFDKSMR